LVFSKDPYAITNYQQINDLTLEMMEKLMEIEFNRPNYFSRDIYPTPSVSVRAIILNENRDKLLMVREANSGTYSFPGGWADLYDSPAQTAINESTQEAGADIEVTRLVGVLNRTPFKTGVYVPEYLIVLEAKLKGKLHAHEYETDDVRRFSLDELPTMSRKVGKEEIDRIIKAVKNNETIFD
jgi:8-oxo-dGTP pyrophosphatase MutT (NUDIX family)